MKTEEFETENVGGLLHLKKEYYRQVIDVSPVQTHPPAPWWHHPMDEAIKPLLMLFVAVVMQAATSG